ncbi:MAG: hypothetical protein LBS97_03985 [Treponema sp.]|jgi:hypothetical protein|nr:hypothetical protein [Treponema sp.]
MKILSFFIILCFGAWLSGAETIRNTDTLRINYPLFGLFAAGAFLFDSANPPDENFEADYELALKLNAGFSGAVYAGALRKSSALSRLAYPLTSSYSSGTSQPSLPSIGRRSDLPGTPGSHPDALAAYFRLPSFHNAEVDLYTNRDGIRGGSITVPAALPSGFDQAVFGQGTLRFTGSVYSYPLSSPEITTWFTSIPQFASGTYTSLLFEAALSSRIAKNRLTGYGAVGLAESPFGGFVPWFRAEPSFSAGIWALRGRFFYAPQDFYTPENTRIVHRFRFTVNPQAHFRLTGQRGLRLSIGLITSGDTSTELYTARISSGISGEAGSVTMTGGLENVFWDSAGIAAGSGTAFPLKIAGTLRLSALRIALSAEAKQYFGAGWVKKKTGYTGTFTLTPRLSASGVIPRELIPALSLGADIASYPDGSTSGKTSASLRWSGALRSFRFTAKIELEIPCDAV